MTPNIIGGPIGDGGITAEERDKMQVELAEEAAPTFGDISSSGVILPAVEKPSKADNVQSPAHYTSGRLETIYHIHDTLGPEGFKAYCIGNTMKYLSRHKGKNGEEDLRKAYVYLGWATDGLPEPVNGRVPT